MAINTTAKGVPFDMARFVQNNQDEVALGNMAVNARGDILGKGGKIEVKRDEVVRSYYRETPASTIETPLSGISLEPAPTLKEIDDPMDEPDTNVVEEIEPIEEEKKPTARKKTRK